MIPRQARAALLAALLAVLAGACAAPPGHDAPHWQVLPVGATASLRGLCAVDRCHVWVTGSAGTLLRTADGGATWQAVGPQQFARADFRDVVAWSDQQALVLIAGEPAQLLATNDGGKQWCRAFAEPTTGAFFDALAHLEQQVVLLGDPLAGAFYLRSSADGGGHWQTPVRATWPAARLGEASFAASGSCVHLFAPGDFAWVTGGTACRFLRPARGIAVDLPLLHGSDSQGAFSLAFASDGLRGVVVGGDYQAPQHGVAVAASTCDGGASWQPARVGPRAYRSAVVWLHAATWVAIGPQGGDISHDGGATWQRFGDLGGHCLAYADGVLWLAGANGLVARTNSR